MATMKLTNSTVSVTGRNFSADRSVVYDKDIDHKTGGYVLTYRPHKSHDDNMGVHALVYEMMIIAANDMLAVNIPLFDGEYTAAQMAGEVAYMWMFSNNSEYKCIRIEAGTFSCGFASRHVFHQMAEWEGVAGVKPKDVYRFTVEVAQNKARDISLKPYKRHSYTPKKVSYASEDRRIAEKLAVIGQLANSLNREGMIKALSLLTAIRSAEKMYNYALASIAKKTMRYWHWEAYRKDKNAEPVSFSEQDIKYGPEIWQQVDKDYAIRLLERFRKFLADNAAPSWIKKGDMVQLKNQDAAPKMFKGKLKVCEVSGKLDYYCTRIDWYAEVCTTKGRWESKEYLAGTLEPWSDEQPKSDKPKATKPKAKAKEKPIPTAKPLTLAEQLRKALTERLKNSNIKTEWNTLKTA